MGSHRDDLRRAAASKHAKGQLWVELVKRSAWAPPPVAQIVAEPSLWAAPRDARAEPPPPPNLEFRALYLKDLQDLKDLTMMELGEQSESEKEETAKRADARAKAGLDKLKRKRRYRPPLPPTKPAPIKGAPGPPANILSGYSSQPASKNAWAHKVRSPAQRKTSRRCSYVAVGERACGLSSQREGSF